MVAKPSFDTIYDLYTCSIVENGEVQLQHIIFFFHDPWILPNKVCLPLNKYNQFEKINALFEDK